VELLVVTAIVSLLAGITFPILREAKTKAKISSCQGNLRQLHVALTLYRVDNNGDGRYGDMSLMGLPPGLKELSVAQKIPRETFVCRGTTRIPVGPLYTVHYSAEDEIGTYPWASYARLYEESSVVLGDQNHEFPGHDVQSPALDHRRIGLFLDGHMKVIVRKGDPFNLPWWNGK
jgi:type II secretory pathway pseudopilin PulG